MTTKFPRLTLGLAAYVFSDIETEAREVRAYAESTERFTAPQIEELVEKWRAMSKRERALALTNMREQRRRHEDRVARVMEAVQEAKEPKTKEG
jgi:hypothetical protein